MITIQTTTIEQVLPIRHKAMYPDGPITLAQTEDDLHATHYGLFIDQQCLSVITAVDHDDTIQPSKIRDPAKPSKSRLREHVIKSCAIII